MMYNVLRVSGSGRVLCHYAEYHRAETAKLLKVKKNCYKLNHDSPTCNSPLVSAECIAQDVCTVRASHAEARVRGDHIDPAANIVVHNFCLLDQGHCRNCRIIQ